MQQWLFILFLVFPLTSLAERASFDEWLEGIKSQARERGISEPVVAMLDDLEPDDRVIGFDRRQPEFVQTMEEYLEARVTEYRIRTAREHYRANLEDLQRIGDRYGVEPRFIIAFWGLESSFGQYQGKYDVLRSLATLAYDPRRSAFFTSELLAALQILDEGHVSRQEFVGGWAGALGQNQFLPSNFLRYAQDFDGDGRKNIWSEQVDVWASIANYLKQHGWTKGAGWGSRVELTEAIDYEALRPEEVDPACRALRSHTSKLPLSAWEGKGVRPASELPAGPWALIIPQSGDEADWLVGGNFRSILRYNCANKYAVSVGLLADAILAAN